MNRVSIGRHCCAQSAHVDACKGIVARARGRGPSERQHHGVAGNTGQRRGQRREWPARHGEPPALPRRLSPLARAGGAGGTCDEWRPCPDLGLRGGRCALEPGLQVRALARLIIALDRSPARGKPAAARGGLAIGQGWDRRTKCQSRGTPLTKRQPWVEVHGAGSPPPGAGGGPASRPWGAIASLRCFPRSSVGGRAVMRGPDFSELSATGTSLPRGMLFARVCSGT